MQKPIGTKRLLIFNIKIDLPFLVEFISVQYPWPVLIYGHGHSLTYGYLISHMKMRSFLEGKTDG